MSAELSTAVPLPRQKAQPFQYLGMLRSPLPQYVHLCPRIGPLGEGVARRSGVRRKSAADFRGQRYGYRLAVLQTRYHSHDSVIA
jgi:hypothetical protein